MKGIIVAGGSGVSHPEAGELSAERLGRGYAWFDTGTHDSLLEAGESVRTIEHRQGLRMACLEEIAWRKGYIGIEDLVRLGCHYGENGYGNWLRRLMTEGDWRNSAY